MREAKNGGTESKFSYSQTKFLVVMSVLMGLIIADVSLIRIYDFVSKLFIPTDLREWLFTVISISILITLIVLLRYIRPTQIGGQRKTKLPIRFIYLITKLVLYASGVMVVYIIIQIFTGSSYSTIDLNIVILLSYVLSIGILSVFVVRLARLISFNSRKLILLLFAVAMGSVTMNIIVTLIDAYLRLEERPDETRVFLGGSTDFGKGRYETLDALYFMSYLASFITAWIATAALLRHYSHRIGKLKYWLIGSVPMIIFAAQFIPSYAGILFPSIKLDPFFIATMVTFIATLSKPIAGLMLGIGFWTMARVAQKTSPIRRYLVFAGFGFLLLFSSNQAILLSIAPYPPFGIVTTTVIGIASYLVVVGLYSSTVSLSQDNELRRSMKNIARSQFDFLGSIVSAESNREIENRVIELVKKQSVELEDRSGISTSLSIEEARMYLKEVLEEVKKKQNSEGI